MMAQIKRLGCELVYFIGLVRQYSQSIEIRRVSTWKKERKKKKRFWQNWKKNKLKGWPCSEFSANGVITIVEDFPLKQIQVHCRIPHGILNVPWQFSSILVDEGIVKVKNLLITLKSSYRHHKLLQTKQNTALPFQTMV